MSRIKFRVQLQLKITLLLLFEINTIYFIPVQVILHYQLQNIHQCFPLLALLGTTLLFCPVFAVLLYVSLLLSLFFASSRSQILFGKKFIFNISLTLPFDNRDLSHLNFIFLRAFFYLSLSYPALHEFDNEYDN